MKLEFLKRVLSLFLALVLTASCVPVQAFATETETTAATEAVETAAPETTAPTAVETVAATEPPVPETTETVPEISEETVAQTVPETTEATASESTEATVPETTEETVPEIAVTLGEAAPMLLSAAEDSWDVDTDALYNTISVKPGQLLPETCEVAESEIYGYVAGYPLKKGHVLSISDTDYVFSVRRLVDGNYTTLLKSATTGSFTATEDMTVAMLIRKPDKSALTAEELASIVLYDSQFGMIGVEGSVKRFTVDAETIDGGTASTRAAIFLPDSYASSGDPTRLIVMTNGYSAHLTDSVWNGNTADNVGIIRSYLNVGYAVYVVDNTAARTAQTPDIGCPQLVSSYRKAYEYIQSHFNVEDKFSIHSRSFGTFAAMRIMQEIPELVKCAVMTGPRVSAQLAYSYVDKAFVANRFGFTDSTGGTYEADKMVGHDPYTDVDGAQYSLPPTYWAMSQGDDTEEPLEVIEKLIAHGNDVTTVTHTGTNHTGVCTLNTEKMFSAALAFLEEHQTEKVEKTPESLDDLAWENLTYRDIFITNNIAYVDGFNAKSYSPFVQSTGSNTITADACYTGPYALAAFGSPSQQLASAETLGTAGEYFLASKVYCTRYAAGALGVCLGYHSVGVQAVTDDFVTASGIVTAEATNKAFLGSFHSADLDGYVDDPVAVHMGIFTTAPTVEQLTALYENYVALEKARDRETVKYSDEEKLAAFVQYMNEKSTALGMTGSTFRDPVGIDNKSTAEDLLRLLVYADRYEQLADVWGESSYTVSVGGENERQQTVVSTVIKPELENYYHILGGKTGTLSAYDARNLAVILEIPNSSDRLAVVALYAEGLDTETNNRYEAVRQIADAAMVKYADSTADNSATEVCCQSAVACLIPAGGANLNDLQILYSKDADTQLVPASITKVLSAICALDIQSDLDAVFTYNTFDTQIGSFYAKDFQPGDTLSYSDALYAMLLPSSNVTARAVARTLGEAILEEDLHAEVEKEPEISQNNTAFAGKVISILGDSISTFAGYIPTADGFNLEHYARYPQDNLLTDVRETWWMQVITELDAKLGINESWRSTEVYNYIDEEVNSSYDGTKTCMASTTRIQNLGSNGIPDVILFYGGTNDITQRRTVGTFDPATAPTTVDLTSVKWDTVADAYVAAIMRMQHYYPDAEIIAMLPTFTSKNTDAVLEKYNSVFAAICDHYGVTWVDLRECGITTSDLPDGTHPDAAGMDYITEAVLETLSSVEMEAGEHVVYSVTHNLTNAEASLGYYQGISSGAAFGETITEENLSVTVTMGSADITGSCYADGKIQIPKVTGHLVITAKAGFSLGSRLQALPETVCAGTNLWTALTPVNEYYTASGWGALASGNSWSVTIPVSAGEKIYATSFEAYGKNGNGDSTSSGIRVTYFDKNGVLKAMAPGDTYAEFTANGGYITAPEGATAVNIPMWNGSEENELYLLNRPHSYSSGKCTICGTAESGLANYKGKVISILGDSISTFAGYIPTADGFNLVHRTRYPDTSQIPDVTKVEQTWWMQLITKLDAKLGINDSWAGSTVYWGDNMVTKNSDTGEKAAMASLTRIQNLGSNGTPDVIFFYGGGNDMTKTVTVGTFDPAKAPTTAELKATQWETFADAYTAAILRLKHYYPDALIVALVQNPSRRWTEAKRMQYTAVIEAICQHYNVPYVRLEDSGITLDNLPDGVHPDDAGMDCITNAVIQTLLSDCEMTAGAQTVHTVTHVLTGAESSLGHYKGVSHGKSFVTAITGDSLTVTVTMGGKDITESVYADGVVNIPKVTDDIVITASGKVKPVYEDHLQQLPGNICSGTNLWTALKPEHGYYTASGWGQNATGTVHSVTIPVQSGDRIWATSFGPAGENGDKSNGTRITWFGEEEVLASLSRDQVYAEFAKNGYITVPEYAVALNIPMANKDGNFKIYLLNRPHSYSSGKCTICGESAPNLAGKTLSILGASISTYEGTSNGAAADTTNSTIRKNVKYYPNTTIPEVTLNDTWWMQVCEDLGLRLLVNNAWSGSAILLERSGTVGAYVDRCVQLHDDTGDNAGEEPDIICIQMGFNDFSYGKDTLGTADIDYDSLITADGYGTPATTMEATAIMLDKMVKRYPNAEIYMFNHFKRIGQSASDTALMEDLNASIEKVCARFGVQVVDLYTTLTQPEHIGDGRLHPNRLGMDTITEAVKKSITENTGYQVQTHTVAFDLDNVTADYGADKLVVSGDAFTVNLTAEDELHVTVTMGGKDITNNAYANGTVAIEAVTGDVAIEAWSEHEPQNYRWSFDGADLASAIGGNTLTKTAGTTTNGVFSKTKYTLEKAVVLSHDQPWAVEWKSEGTWKNTSGSGGRMFTTTPVNADYNARYIFKSSTNGLIAMGEKTTTGSHNYGIALADHGIDASVDHTYRLENRVNSDGSNMVYLHVDGKEIGPMTGYYVGTNSQGTTSNWLSGQDFVFPYMGTDTHGLNNCSIDYIQVWEGGAPEKAEDLGDFYGKTISILGDSISTYTNVSSGSAADTTNSTIRGGAVYYSPGRLDVWQEDTWWQQAIDALGMELLVNNSWSGSTVLHNRSGTVGAYVDRCVQLHDNTGDNAGEEPDVIAVFLGTNDFSYYQDTLGTADAIDYASLITDNGDGSYTYAEPATTCEAYAVMLHKMTHRYPDADIYCMTLTARRDPDKVDSYADVGQPTAFNAELTKIIRFFGCTVVDLENCGITKDAETFDYYMGDGRVHPGEEGMDKITQALLNAMAGQDMTWYTVSSNADLDVLDFTAGGMEFGCMLPTGAGISVSATMGGEDITDQCVTDGAVHIPKVTGDIVITVTREPQSYRWEFDGTDLTSVTTGGNVGNSLTKLAGTTADGTFTSTRYDMVIPVELRHNEPWIVEWKGEGAGGFMLADNTSSSNSTSYFFRRAGNYLNAFGHYRSGSHHNYGLALTDTEFDGAAMHTYRLVNEIAADGSNMVSLYVDGQKAGPLTGYYVGGTAQGAEDTWISGQDFTFRYIGTTSHPLTDYAMEYLQVWEGGEPEVAWEVGTIASADGQNTSNATRLRTVDYLRLSDFAGVTIDRGYTMTNFVYDENMGYLGTSSWLGSGIGFETAQLQEKYPTGVYFRVALRTLDQAALTAEDIPATGVTFYEPGEEIPIPESDVKSEIVMTIGGWQDGAIYDGKLFVLGGSGTGAVYDLSTLKKLSSFALDNKDVLKPHANSVCFGSTFYAKGDKYPLLYVNVYNNYSTAADRMEGTCCVYRITETNGTFATELVQVIRIGFTENLSLWKSKENNGDVRPYGNFTVDTSNGKLYAFVMRDADKTTRFFRFDLPALTEGDYSETYGCNVVTLESADIETQFDTTYFNYLQGCCYHGGTIISAEGFSSGGSAEPALRIVDISSQKLVKTYYPAEAGLTSEPEVVCVDPADSTLYYAAADGVLRKLTLPEFHQHTFNTVITAPTCTEQGYTTHTCTVCGDSYVDSYVNATGHTYGTWTVATAATCTAKGTERRDCNNCDHYENREIAAKGHTEVIDKAVAATCTETGKTEGKHCSVCNAVLTAQTIIAAKGHSYSDGKCSICGAAEWDTDADGVLEILAIGNSFSIDALEYAYQIAQNLGIEEIVIGNLYISGCSLKTHAANAAGDLAKYTYYYNDNGSWTTTKNYKISTALESRGWDYVSLQQASSYSGVESTYNEDLTRVIAYVQERSDAKLVWHMTWAYQQDSTHNAFATYGKNQMTMYNSIVSAVQNKIVTNDAFDLIVPNGTAVQNSRTSLLGDTTTRDGYHMSRDYGRYLTGLQFIKTVTGLSVDSITYAPSGVDAQEKNIAIESVNNAYVQPFAVTQSRYVKEEQAVPEEGYILLQSELYKGAFWDPTSAERYNELFFDKSNSHQYFATIRFTRETLPVGSIITLADGWRYRPDGWITDTVQTGAREPVTTEPYVVVTEEWWENYSIRGFNISKVGLPSLENVTEEEVRNAFRIYVPEEKHAHVYTSVVTAPTCTERGYTTHTCACGDSYVDSYVNATGHSYGAWTVTTAATCTAKGTECRDCNNCDHYETREIAAKGHTEVIDKAVAATCTAAGKTEGKHCSVCNAVLTAQTTIPAKGHSYGTWTVATAATCTAKGTERRDCNNCDHYETREIAAKGHTAVIDKAVAATCTAAGKTEGKHCSVCNAVIIAQTTIPATGHSYGAWTVTTAASCTAKGTERRDCNNCDHYETREIAAKGHSWDNGAVTKEPTENVEGVRTYTCKVCGETRTEVIPALGHTHKYTEKVTAPTCTERGYTTHTCACGHSYVDSYVNATGHSYSAWAVTTAATCTVKGTERRDCNNCDHYETREIAAKGHTAVIDKVVAATCTAAGKTEGKHCSVCNTVLTAQTTIPATGHSYGAWTVTTAASCTAKGTERRDCVNCDHYETREIAAKGHTEVIDKAVAATCTATGLTEGKHCSVCGTVLTAQKEVPALGHKWNSGVVTKEPTEETEGVRTYTCSTCGETRTETIPTLDHVHKYTAAVTAPTCTERGYTTYTCRCGDSYVDDYVEADGHEAGEWITDEVNHWRSCTNCGEIVESGIHDGANCGICGHIGQGHGFRLGDANHDGEINAKDATRILQYSVGALANSVTFCEICAEVRGDDDLNAKDSTLILQFSVGNRTHFPAEE